VVSIYAVGMVGMVYYLGRTSKHRLGGVKLKVNQKAS